MKCCICNGEYNQLHSHIVRSHKEISIEEYYLKYMLDGVIPKCVVCDSLARFHTIVDGYHKTCGSKKCSNKLKGITFNETIEKKYGDKSSFYNKRDNTTKQANLERYGVENVFQLDSVKDKIKQTNLERYGVENPMSTSDIQDKVKKTNLDRYGVEYSQQCDMILNKTKQTNLERYGVENVFQSDDIKSKLIEIRKNKPDEDKKETIERRQNTNLERYGVKNVFNLPKTKDKAKLSHKKIILDRYGACCLSHIPGVVDKIHNSKKENGTYGKSKKEDTLFEIISNLYPDVIRQHKNDNYDFYCDFYIPSIDLYIEYQGFISHRLDNIGAFYGSKKQLKLIDEITTKVNDHPAYTNYLKVWVYSDPFKREVANNNKLNWIELFEIESLENMIRRELYGLCFKTTDDCLNKQYSSINNKSGDISSTIMLQEIIFNPISLKRKMNFGLIKKSGLN